MGRELGESEQIEAAAALLEQAEQLAEEKINQLRRDSSSRSMDWTIRLFATLNNLLSFRATPDDFETSLRIIRMFGSLESGYELKGEEVPGALRWFRDHELLLIPSKLHEVALDAYKEGYLSKLHMEVVELLRHPEEVA